MGAEERRPLNVLESVASQLGIMFLRKKMDEGGVVEVPSLNSVMFRTPDGGYALKELERPADFDEKRWEKMTFKDRRSELVTRRALELVGKVPVAEIEQLIQNELGPLPPDFSVPSDI